MALRDAITDSEKFKLVRLLRAGHPWEQVRKSLPEVNPAALDANFKAWAHTKAGVKPVVKPVAKPNPLE